LISVLVNVLFTGITVHGYDTPCRPDASYTLRYQSKFSPLITRTTRFSNDFYYVWFEKLSDIWV